MNVKTHHTSNQLLKMYKIESNPRLARRIHGVYLANKGHTCPEIMQIIGASRRAIQQWVQKYNNGGTEALKDKPRPGKPTTLPRHKEQKFCRRIASGVIYSLWGVYDLLHRLGYSCLCPRPQHENANPQLQAEFKKTYPRGWIQSN